MKVLIIPSWYKTVSNPTSGSFFEEQARIINKQEEIEVEIFYPYLTNVKEDNPRVLIDKGIKTYYYPIYYTGNANLWAKGVWLKFNNNSLTNNIEKLNSFGFDIKKYSIIHSHSVFVGGVFANYFSVKHNIPYVLTEHASFITDYKTYLRQGKINFLKLNIHNLLFKLFCKNRIENIYLKASSVIFVSSYQKEKILNYYRLNSLNYRIIPNLVNPLFFKNINEGNLNINSSTSFYILAIGMFTPNKRFDLLINSFHKASMSDDGLRLNIVGDGDLLSSLKKQCEKLNIANKVNFFGRLDRIEIARTIRESNVLMSSSEFETFGLTVAESLATGTPVIVTDSGGIRDIVSTEDGFIVSSDSGSISKSILKIKKDYSKFNFQDIQRRAYELFSEEKVSEKIVKVYSESIN